MTTEYEEPTALAYTPDHLMPTEPMSPEIWDALGADTREETVALACASARRWAARRDLSPELRLRRMYQVLITAMEEL